MEIPVRTIALLFGCCLLLTPPGGVATPQEDPVPCGPDEEKHIVIKHSARPSPSPAPGKALVYVIKSGRMAQFQGKLALDGKWVAVVDKGTYTYFETEPGLKRLCYNGGHGEEKRFKSETRMLLTRMFLTLEADKTYYLEANHPYMGPTHLLELSPEKGEGLILKRRYVTFGPKP